MKKALIILFSLAFFLTASAQDRFEGKLEFDRTVHDFGNIPANGGAISCSFSVKNISDKPLTILTVVSSCGCTKVEWTRSEIKPGATGAVSATYENEDGPYPFDKTLSVYVSDLRKPVILHLRGIAVEKELPLAEGYPVHFGSLAMRSASIQAPNLSQGEQRSSEVVVANIGKSPITVTFKDVSDGLSITMKDEKIAPGKESRIVYTITADASRWGKNWYYATPLVNGKVLASSGTARKEEPVMGSDALVIDENPALAQGCTKIGFSAVTKANFSSMSRKEMAEEANPYFEQSTFSYGKVKAGKTVDVQFSLTNKGKKDLRIYKLDYESARVKGPAIVSSLAPGAQTTLKMTLDTAGLSKGEHMFIVNLYTSSPFRPVITLYITGFVQ